MEEQGQQSTCVMKKSLEDKKIITGMFGEL